MNRLARPRDQAGPATANPIIVSRSQSEPITESGFDTWRRISREEKARAPHSARSSSSILRPTRRQVESPGGSISVAAPIL
ncbi:MAG TPA: hypothetical protein VGR46_04025 [Candidatus Limnocylindria bacterium]|nr:hypothetical protein [Candidatus Limnocylindria bacterium]